MEAMEAARWEAAIGRNPKRYLAVFERIRARGRWAPGWNSAAFLHSSAWFCYRRMYGLAVLNFFAPLLVVMALVFGGGLTLFFLAGYLAFVFILVPAFADALYYRHLEARLERARPPSLWTGLAAGGLIAVSIALVVMSMNLGRADYTRRSKVSEVILSGMSMRAQVTEFFQQQGRLPGQAEAAKFDARPTSKYVESVGYDSARNAVVLRLREPFAGKHLELRPEVQGADLLWRCGSPDLPKKDLPGTCTD
jgi:Pilin (bacterial filament)